MGSAPLLRIGGSYRLSPGAWDRAREGEEEEEKGRIARGKNKGLKMGNTTVGGGRETQEQWFET